MLLSSFVKKALKFSAFSRLSDPSQRSFANFHFNGVGALVTHSSASHRPPQKFALQQKRTIADVDASGLWLTRLSQRLRRLDRIGRQSPSIRITWSVIRRATPVTSHGRTGSCRAGRRPVRRGPLGDDDRSAGGRPPIFAQSIDYQGCIGGASRRYDPSR
jgi:hypothetical protein